MENKTSAINIQVDSNVKKEATDVLTELGLSMSSAINLFLKQVVKKIHQPRPAPKAGKKIGAIRKIVYRRPM